MSQLSRRQFLNHSLAAAGVSAGFAIGGTKSSGRVIGANDRVRVGVAGLNSRGASHVDAFTNDVSGTEVAYLIANEGRRLLEWRAGRRRAAYRARRVVHRSGGCCCRRCSRYKQQQHQQQQQRSHRVLLGTVPRSRRRQRVQCPPDG